MEHIVTYVNPINVKVEMEEEDEDIVPCNVCGKVFASSMALGNHFRVEHSSYADPEVNYVARSPEKFISRKRKSSPVKVKYNFTPEEEERRKEEFLSSLKPVNLVSLASEDVSYIIIKSEDIEASPEQEKKRSRKEKTGESSQKKDDKLKRQYLKRDKNPEPITGPFECLQPSTVMADQVCHQIFFSCCEYSTHFRDDHTKRRKGQRCQVCEKPLTPGVGDEPIHLFSCQICGAAHVNNRALQDHINTEHVKLRPFQCNVCDKRFTQQGGLMQHMRMHTGERPYECNYCPKAFTQKSGLEQHVRTHTKVKPYRCVVCSKNFCQSIHLKQHMRIHTNVSPFQCGICQKRFKQSSHLNYHLKSHTDGAMTDEQKERLMELIQQNCVVEMAGEENEVIVGEMDTARDENLVLDENVYVIQA